MPATTGGAGSVRSRTPPPSGCCADARPTGRLRFLSTFEDKAACDAYKAGEVFAAVAGNPNFVNATAKDFGIVEGPTRVTRGL